MVALEKLRMSMNIHIYVCACRKERGAGLFYAFGVVACKD